MNAKQKAKNQKNRDNESSPSSSPSLHAIWTLGFSLAALPLMARAERIYGDLPQLTKQHCPPELPSLSIIVPARNEEHNLRRLLPSLERQNYPGEIEIIVIGKQYT